MYTQYTNQKIINFFLVVAMIFFTISATLFLKKYVPPEYYSLSEGIRSAKLSLSSMKYNMEYNNSLAKNGQEAFAGRSVLNASTATSTPENAIDIPVLVYHGIVKKTDRFSMTDQTFSDQMFALKRNGYRTITIDDLNQFIHGTKSLPDKSFLLTFDDGRTDSYEGADPVLNALGFHAVMFVATGDSLNKILKPHSYYLDEVALHRMVDSGRWELGSHAIQENTDGGQIVIDAKGTEGNFLSNRMWLTKFNRLETLAEYTARVEHELSDSKKDLENKFGVSVIALSYPFSDFGEQSVNNPSAIGIISQIMKENYSLAFQQIWPIDNDYVLNYVGDNAYHLKRIESGTNWTGDYLISMLDKGHAKPLPFTDTFSSDLGWSGTWGIVEVAHNQLHLASTASSTGAFAFLDGTRMYDNYLFNANLFVEKGGYVSLFARLINSDNNLSCVFTDKNVRIDQKVNGVSTTLTQIENTYEVPYPLVSLGISVSGSVVRCLEGRETVAQSIIPDEGIKNGGVGIQIWDPKMHNASVYANKVQIVSVNDAATFRKTLPEYNQK